MNTDSTLSLIHHSQRNDEDEDGYNKYLNDDDNVDNENSRSFYNKIRIRQQKQRKFTIYTLFPNPFSTGSRRVDGDLDDEEHAGDGHLRYHESVVKSDLSSQKQLRNCSVWINICGSGFIVSAIVAILLIITFSVICFYSPEQRNFSLKTKYGRYGIALVLLITLIQSFLAYLFGLCIGFDFGVKEWNYGRTLWIGFALLFLTSSSLITFMISPYNIIFELPGPIIVPLSNKSPLYPNLNSLEDPSLQWYNSSIFYYGQGVDGTPSYYTSSRVKYRTTGVNATLFAPDYPKHLSNYWKFNPSNFPLNGKLFYPTLVGRATPLVIIAHGNNYLKKRSEEGYTYIAKTLSRKGYIVSSIDLNFLNGYDGPSDRNDIDLRGYMILKHIQQIYNFSQDPNNILYQNVDVDSISLIGHGRGGGAIHTAYLWNREKCVKVGKYTNNCIELNETFNYSIKALVYLAPDFGFYDGAAWNLPSLSGTNSMLLQGMHDINAIPSFGTFGLNSVNKTEGHFVNMAKYLFKANHNQFNSIWNEDDVSIPTSWFLHRSVMKHYTQRKLTILYISAFLDSFVLDDIKYISFLRDERLGRAWLPLARDSLAISSYTDSRYSVMIADFEPSDDTLINSTLQPYWNCSRKDAKEESMMLRDDETPQRNRALMIRASKRQNVTMDMTLPSPLSTTDYAVLIFDIAVHKGHLKELQIQLNDGAFVNLSAYYPLPRTLPVYIFKFPLSVQERAEYPRSYETLLQTIEIPLESLQSPSSIKTITFNVIGGADGVSIYLDNIGLRVGLV